MKVGVEENDLSTIQITTQRNHVLYIKLGNSKPFKLKLEMQQGCQLYQHCLEVLTNAIGQENKTSGINIIRKGSKQLGNEMTIRTIINYIYQRPRVSNKYYWLIRIFAKVAQYWQVYQNIAILYACNK